MRFARRMPGRVRPRAGGGGASDWRFGLPGIQASFRRGPDDEYAVIVGGLEIDSITDSIPQAAKSTSAAPYVVQAPSAGQRPGAGAGRSMQFVGSSTDTLQDAGPGLAPLMTGAVSVYVVAAMTDGIVASCGSAAVTNDIIAIRRVAGNYRWRRADGANDDSVSTAIDTAAHVVAGTHGASLRSYIDGALVGLTASSAVPSGVDRFSIGSVRFNGAPQVWATATVYEVVVCLADHDAATVAAVTARLRQEYGV